MQRHLKKTYLKNITNVYKVSKSVKKTYDFFLIKMHMKIYNRV